ncbi:MAG: UPF0149 family protein [Giesbergeria sp.]|uniref:UPF0149 family protein n=1 Tax=Giesbergeria sp. TaxID=2818473 RepID=UPI002612F1A6|nr:UPF0149 family protein [Giesbergeria sp.]MDD2610417.1 UPF0149 family protein [Giesbergeria sp.]
MTDTLVDTSTPESAARGISPDELDELDTLLNELRAHAEEIPEWEFCDGFLTALVCSRRPIGPEEYLPMLLGDGQVLELGADGALPHLPIFATAAQQARFLALFTQRWQAVQTALDLPQEQRTEQNAFHPEVEDVRAVVASLPEAEQAEIEDYDIPALGQVWALGFMFAVENWPEEWATPRDKEVAQWLDESLDSIVALTEDDTGKPSVNLYDENGPATISEQRLDHFSAALAAVYDLRQLWQSMGPRIESIRKAPAPGRNDPCSCGSGKKYKKCCGAH